MEESDKAQRVPAELIERRIYLVRGLNMFELARDELGILMLQNATSRWGGRRKPPLAFTELGVSMLSSVLNSDRAVQVNILVMRAFVRLRELLARDKDLAVRVERLEAGQKEHRSIIHLLAREIDEMKSIPDPLIRKVM